MRLFWWVEMDSNHRRLCRQIYSLLLLAAQASTQRGAGDRNRTYNLLITNQLLCQLSHTSIKLSLHLTWCLEAESNHRHEDFQSSALPTELSRQI